MLNFITTTLYLILKYAVLFFMAYYLTGSGFKDLSVSPIWQGLFYGISGIGTAIYRATTLFIQGLGLWIFAPMSRTVKKAIIAILDIIVIIALLRLGDFLITAAINTWVGDLAVGVDITELGDMEGRLTNVIGVLSVVKACWQAGEGFFGSIGHAVSAIAIYSVIYCVGYSIIFGYLETRMHELHLISGEYEEREPESPKYTFKELPKRCRECVTDWIDSFAVLTRFSNEDVAGGTFALAMAVSGVMCVRDDPRGFGALLGLLLDSSGLIGSIQTFLCIAGMNFVVQLLICYALPLVLPFMRGKLMFLSDKATAYIQDAQVKRKDWTREHDYLNQGGERPSGFTPSKKMNLH